VVTAVGGKGSQPIALAILDALKIPAYCVFDGDAHATDGNECQTCGRVKRDRTCAALTGPQSPGVERPGWTPVAPVLYPRAGSGLWAPILEEGEEWGLGLDGDDVVGVEPDALEDEAEELSLGGGLCLFSQNTVKSSSTCWAWSRSRSGCGASAESSAWIASRRSLAQDLPRPRCAAPVRRRPCSRDQLRVVSGSHPGGHEGAGPSACGHGGGLEPQARRRGRRGALPVAWRAAGACRWPRAPASRFARRRRICSQSVYSISIVVR